MRVKGIFTSIPLLVGVFLIIYAGFGLVYFQKQAEWRDLNSQIIPTRTILEKTSFNPGQLDGQLSNIESQLDQAWTFFPGRDQGIDLYDALVEVARLSNVEIVNIVAAMPLEETYQGMQYAILPYSINVEGSENSILNFVSNLANGPGLLQSSEVRNINISNTESANTTYYTSKASLQLYVYAQPD